jgi:hypothetical protein
VVNLRAGAFRVLLGPKEGGSLQVTGVAVNELTDASDRDPFTGCPQHKYVRCQSDHRRHD